MNMFPHTITIYRHTVGSNDADVYTRTVISGVYIDDSIGVRGDNRGDVRSDGVSVITNQGLAESYGSAWDAAPGDRIMRGTGEAITSLRDLDGIPDVWTVLRIRRHTPQGRVDNIIIEGA